jgi:two-component system KDP operon response regulator KdpE
MSTRAECRRTSVLVLTSEPAIARLARSILEPRCKVWGAKTDPGALFPDIVIIDAETSELAILLEAKLSYPKARIIALSREYREADCIAVLDMDADYLPRPFRAHDLAARVHVAELRRFNGAARPRYYRHGPLAFDLLKAALAIDGRPIDLSSSERTVLTLLASQPGTVATYGRLYSELGLTDSWKSRRAVRSCVFGLRRKIERDFARPEILLTEMGVGYRLAASMDGLPYRATDPPSEDDHWGLP